jgi:hypothetical protein
MHKHNRYHLGIMLHWTLLQVYFQQVNHSGGWQLMDTQSSVACRVPTQYPIPGCTLLSWPHQVSCPTAHLVVCWLYDYCGRVLLC